MNLLFEVIKQFEGGYVAACYDEHIYTEGANLEELHCNITSAIDCKFTDRPKPNPKAVQLMLYHE